jgi:hypothetical protein
MINLVGEEKNGCDLFILFSWNFLPEDNEIQEQSKS